MFEYLKVKIFFGQDYRILKISGIEKRTGLKGLISFLPGKSCNPV